MTKRPYADASNKLSSAWWHLARRRTRGDNAARRTLRGLRRSLTLAVMNECLTAVWIPTLEKHFSRKSVFASWPQRRKR